jgi:protein-tyrosine sulfotransferase
MKNSSERKSPFQSKFSHRSITLDQLQLSLFHRTEHSSDQVIKPINLAALTQWFGHVPANVRAQLDTLAPMLKKLGYDTQSNTPSYGTPDPLVLENMEKLKKNADFWKDKAKAYAHQPPLRQ